MSTNKQYWKGIEELENSPEFLKNRDNEFAEELPIDAFLGDDKLKESSTSRRDFLKFLGFSVTAATLAACEAPVIKSIPYVAKPEEITPGVATWYASTYYDGNDFANILVKTREGRPIFIKANRKHGITRGAANARVTASVLSLYDSARLTGPMMDGAASDWATVDKAISEKLQSIAKAGGEIRILTGTVISPSTQTIIGDLISSLNGQKASPATLAALAGTPSDSTATPVVMPVVAPVPAAEGAEPAMEATPVGHIRHIQYDAISYSAIRQANKDSFGMPIIPDYDFSKAKAIVSISADFLTNWLLHNEYVAQYASNRRPEGEWMSRHFQFETVLSVTGSSADVRVPIKPSEEGKVAAALYQHITGSKISDVSVELLDKTKAAADELKKNAGASLVVAGSNDVNVQVIVNAINEKLGNYASTINLNNPVNLFAANDALVEELVKEVTGNKIKAILIDGAVNPVYSLKDGVAFGEALSKMELSVSFSQLADETASKCKFICPDHHYLESWNDLNPKANHYAIAQPAIRPLYETRNMQESMLVFGGLATRGSKDSDTYYKVIRKNWELYGFPTQTEIASFEDYWNWNVHNGSGNMSTKSPAQVAFVGDVNKAGSEIKKINGGEFEVVFYQNAGMGNGAHAANPWLQEMPDPITKITWDNYITMSPADMEGKYNTHIGQEWPADLATVKVEGLGEITLPVFPQPGQARGTVGIAIGYGRGANGENIGKAAFQYEQYGEPTMKDGKHVSVGKNVYPFVALAGNHYSYRAYAASVSGTGEKYYLASTQTHQTVMGRESVVKETTFGVYKTGNKDLFNKPKTIVYHEDGKQVDKPVGELNMWKEHPVEHIGHRWGMSIDLNTCIGCGNCVVACNAENNIPVVGKDEVRRGREMHWMRIDRYYSSDMTKERAKEEGVGSISMYSQMENPSDNPQVVFMPMMCHHCNHAPCETVCPVAATTHSNEGLNQMAYNRCIGTRYCANNCPYKVRRFNWFNYPTYKKFTGFNPAQSDMGRLVLNPDVVVRTRGVMEKCSMCVQRIQAGKLEAKKEGRKLVDGDATTACAEACPTHAITFGDWNDTDSEIRKVTDADRSYQALEEVGVKPNIWYQVKVRNIEGKPVAEAKEEHHSEEHSH
ncbi:MAG: TAT-variant-translocated molybdopterin oxidoreductase [Flavobacteriales bacterium]|nr:TAT-variant-translocated molybdopterin oxidoreductase [Flavobacteriales bacterium]